MHAWMNERMNGSQHHTSTHPPTQTTHPLNPPYLGVQGRQDNRHGRPCNEEMPSDNPGEEATQRRANARGRAPAPSTETGEETQRRRRREEDRVCRKGSGRAAVVGRRWGRGGSGGMDGGQGGRQEACAAPAAAAVAAAGGGGARGVGGAAAAALGGWREEQRKEEEKEEGEVEPRQRLGWTHSLLGGAGAGRGSLSACMCVCVGKCARLSLPSSFLWCLESKQGCVLRLVCPTHGWGVTVWWGRKPPSSLSSVCGGREKSEEEQMLGEGLVHPTATLVPVPLSFSWALWWWWGLVGGVPVLWGKGVDRQTRQACFPSSARLSPTTLLCP